MTACSTERRLRRFALAALLPLAGLLLATALTGRAAADQPGTPILLIPSPQLAPPPQAPAAQAPAALPPGATPPAEKVQIQDLAAPSPDAAGLLDEAHGGLGAAAWAGSDGALVQKLFTLLPAPAARTIALLERRLFLSQAAPPAGSPPGSALLILRAQGLMALGDVEDLSAFLKTLPLPSLPPALSHLAAEAALLSGDNGQACAQSALLVGQFPAEAFPIELQAICQYAGGRDADAKLTIDLLREQKVNDPAFFGAADALSGLPPPRSAQQAAQTVPSIALYRLAKLAIGDQPAAPPPIQHAIALSPDAGTTARLAAAERAESFGNLDSETERQIIRAGSFSAEELTQPPGKGPKGRAVLLLQAEGQATPAVKADIIVKALALAGDSGFAAAARLFEPQIALLTPGPDLTNDALPLTRALIAAGHPELARLWLAWLRGVASTGDLNASAALAAAWPLARLSGAEEGHPPLAAPLAGWQQTVNGLPAELVTRRTALLLDLLAATGDAVPASAWAPLYDGPALIVGLKPRPALFLGLKDAADGHRQGETVLDAALSLGDQPLSQIDASDLYRVVDALRRSGLDADARALAVEAAVANGL